MIPTPLFKLDSDFSAAWHRCMQPASGSNSRPEPPTLGTLTPHPYSEHLCYFWHHSSSLTFTAVCLNDRKELLNKKMCVFQWFRENQVMMKIFLFISRLFLTSFLPVDFYSVPEKYVRKKTANSDKREEQKARGIRRRLHWMTPCTRHVAYTAHAAANFSRVTDRCTDSVSISCIRCSLEISKSRFVDILKSAHLGSYVCPCLEISCPELLVVWLCVKRGL